MEGKGEGKELLEKLIARLIEKDSPILLEVKNVEILDIKEAELEDYSIYLIKVRVTTNEDEYEDEFMFVDDNRCLYEGHHCLFDVVPLDNVPQDVIDKIGDYLAFDLE